MKPLALCLALAVATPPLADEMDAAERLTLACMGWSSDRLMIATVGEKHDEMRQALDAIETGNPAKPLAEAVSDSLGAIDRHVLAGQQQSRDPFRAICSP